MAISADFLVAMDSTLLGKTPPADLCPSVDQIESAPRGVSLVGGISSFTRTPECLLQLVWGFRPAPHVGGLFLVWDLAGQRGYRRMS